MTIYDVLEKLVRGYAFRGYEQQAALEVVDELRQINALGTRASTIDAGQHECVAGAPEPGIYQRTWCVICGKRMS